MSSIAAPLTGRVFISAFQKHDLEHDARWLANQLTRAVSVSVSKSASVRS
jgi:hypothetical protein